MDMKTKKSAKKEPVQKLYVVTKYIMAASVKQALEKEKFIKPDDVFVDTDWKKNNL